MSCAEKLVFLELLQQAAPDERFLERLDAAYALTARGNAEIKAVWCALLLAAGSKRAEQLTLDFITSVGRMKFVRPLYRALLSAPIAGVADRARAAFKKHALFYHPICRKMVASDLGVSLAGDDDDDDEPAFEKPRLARLAFAAAAAALLLVLSARLRAAHR